MNKEKEVSLEKLKMDIEQMQKFHHIEVLRILKKHQTVTINENRYGVYINLSFLPDTVTTELETFVKYVSEQEVQLELMEIQKREMKSGDDVGDFLSCRENNAERFCLS